MSEAEQAQEPEVIGPGEILKRAREAQGFSLDDMAGKLHLKSVAIAKLEADDYDESISLTFTKGYLKLYAKHIGVKEQEVLDAFEKHNTENKEPAKLQSFSRRVANQASDDRLMLVTYLVVAAVIAMVVVWWWQQSSSETTAIPETPVTVPLEQGATDKQAIASVVERQAETFSTTQDTLNDVEPEPEPVLEEMAQLADEPIAASTVTAELGDQTEQVDDQIQAGASIADASINEALLVAEEVASDPQSNIVEESSDVPASEQQPVQTVELVFTFADDCWMNLVDGTGEAIAYGVKKSGRVMTVAGVPPFEVTLGAPAVVQISYAGSDVDMSQFDAGRTAKFSLPFAG